jgi:hypothetical protein
MEARAGGRCSKRVGREAARGRPGACGGRSGADSTGGGAAQHGSAPKDGLRCSGGASWLDGARQGRGQRSSVTVRWSWWPRLEAAAR